MEDMREFLPGIRLLKKAYRLAIKDGVTHTTATGQAILKRYLGYNEIHCPLCIVSWSQWHKDYGSHCGYCLWEVFDGIFCPWHALSPNLTIGATEDYSLKHRIKRLDRYSKKIYRLEKSLKAQKTPKKLTTKREK